MTAPKLAVDGFHGRVYKDTLADCPILEQHGWSGPFEAPSVTNVNNVADKGGGLDLWKRRTVAEYAIDNTDEWVELDVHPVNPDKWEATVKRLAERAGWRGRGAKSVYVRALAEYQQAYDGKDRDACLAWHRKLMVDLIAAAPDRHAREKAQQGTGLHKVFEDVANGRTPVALFPGDQAHIDQVRDFFDRWQPEIICCEQSVFSRRHGYAGTPDTFLKLPSVGPVLADLKRRGGSYDGIAYQLAPYAEADYMITAGIGAHRAPVPQVVAAAEINFPPEPDEDGRFRPAQVIPVDLDGAMDVFLGRLNEFHDKKRKRLRDPLDVPAVIPGDPDKRAHLETRVACLKAWYRDAALWASAHWPEGVPTLKQSGGHTAAELDLIEQVLNDAEAACEVPFYEVANPNNSESMSTGVQTA